MIDIELEKKELRNKYKKIKLLTIIGYILTYMMYIFKDYYLMFIKVLLISLNIDLYLQEIIILTLKELLFALPIGICITGQMTNRKIKRDINELDYYKKIHSYDEEKENLKKELNDEQKEYIQKIISRFEKLPRDKQMEILNYIKGDIKLNKDSLYKDIDMLNNTGINILQDTIEDKLFPDFDKDKVKKYKKYMN